MLLECFTPFLNKSVQQTKAVMFDMFYTACSWLSGVGLGNQLTKWCDDLQARAANFETEELGWSPSPSLTSVFCACVHITQSPYA